MGHHPHRGPEQKVSALIHQRMTEIAQGVATAYRCTAEVEFSDYCPCMVVDTRWRVTP